MMKIDDNTYTRIFNQFYHLEKHFPQLNDMILKHEKGQSPYADILKDARATYEKDRAQLRLKNLKDIDRTQQTKSKGRGR